MKKKSFAGSVLAAVLSVSCAVASGARADETVTACGPYANNVFQHAAVFGINTGGTCPNPPYSGGGMGIWSAGNRVAQGRTARWQTTAPPGLTIVGASIPNGSLVSEGVNDGQQYGGGFYWAGGGAQTHDGETSVGFGPFSSSYLGFQLVCGVPTCTTGVSQLDVGEINLYVRETSGPYLVAPDGLWQAPGWIRGDWTIHFYGDSPSGLCGLSSSVNGQSAPGSSSGQDPSVWHQCGAPAVAQTIHTWQHGQGAMPLTIAAWDAAGVPVSYTKTIYVDNSQPQVLMSGPTDVPSTAGVQYVSATAGGSPSGIAGLSCSVDGASAQWYAGSSAEIPVSGVGPHSVRCSAANNAVDGAGNHGWSSPGVWTVKIGAPTLVAIGFGRLVNAPLCRRVGERTKVAARWVTIYRHHTFVRVRRPAHWKRMVVTRCHLRVVRRRITVWTIVSRHGRKVRVRRHKTIKVPLFPHVVLHASRRVAHGTAIAVSGWLGAADGTPLAGQSVRVLAAPDNGLGRFTQVGTATTTSNGSWGLQLPAGPSRLVEAVYDGAPTLEASVSQQVALIVPAKVKLLTVFPSHVAWGGTVRIVGQLAGGYLPPGGALVRLRIGSGSTYTTYGVQEHVTGSGRFSTTYTFGMGDPGFFRTFWFQIASLPMGDYPWAPAASAKRFVLVGGHPSIPPRQPSRHHHPKRRGHHRRRKR